MLRDHAAVHGRRVRPRAGLARRDLGRDRGVGREQPVHRHLLELPDLPGFRPSSVISMLVVRTASARLVKRRIAPLSMIGAVEQPRAVGHRHQRRHLSTAAGLPEDGHEIRIAAEALDVRLHPLERRDDVEHAGGAGSGKVGAADVAEIGVAERRSGDG